MKLLEVYSLLEAQKITLEEAARVWGATPGGLKTRLTRRGHKMPLVLGVLDKIAEDKISRDEAAEVLGVSPREVNDLMNRWSIKRPLKEYRVDREAAQVKWEVRKMYSIDYIAGRMTLEQASEAAGVSDRQMRRWVSTMLKEHFGATFMDLRYMPLIKRQRLASEIEDAERLVRERKNVLKAVADGRKSVRELALDRVLEKA